MKQLAKQFEGRGQMKGYLFVQNFVNEHAFLYELVCRETGRSHYEIFRRKENRQFDCISYPTEKAFGVWAWTTHSPSKALQIFKNITNERNVKD